MSISRPRLVASSRRSGRTRTLPRDLAHLSDEAVVALAARSDETALAELYDRYGRAAYALAHRVLRDESLAEDAVQEAFLAVWRGAHHFLPEKAKASTWILTLVHRRAVDLRHDIVWQVGQHVEEFEGFGGAQAVWKSRASAPELFASDSRCEE